MQVGLGEASSSDPVGFASHWTMTPTSNRTVNKASADPQIDSSPSATSKGRRPPRDRRDVPVGRAPRLLALRLSKPSFPWPPLQQLIDHTLATELGLR
jgi:hypothetical protein